MNKLFVFLMGLVVVVNLVFPTLVFAQNSSTFFGLVPCTEPDFPTPDTSGVSRENVCDWNALIKLARNIMNFAIMLAIPIGGAIIAYAGFLLVAAGPDTGAREKAKGLIWNVVIGLLISLSAWLVVYLITSSLVGSNYILLKN